jgi:WD40 repeat protein
VDGDREYRATIEWSGSGETADLALLGITDPPFAQEMAPVWFARVDRGSPEPVSGCWAVGFPRFKEKVESSRAGARLRDSAHLRGEILPGANLVSGLLELQVTATPRSLPAGGVGVSEWQGISGAVVFAADHRLGYCAVGVVVEHHRPEGESSLTVVPITALETMGRAEERERWWELLDVADPSQLAVLPRPTERNRPDYWATVEEIARRAPVLLERDDRLADLAAFATGTEGYRWLIGKPWAGKSAMVAHLARACPPEVDCVAYFLVRRLADADSGRFTAVVSTQLAWLLEKDAPARLDDPDVWRSLWAQAVERAEQTGRHLLLVVDGLDEDMSHQLSRPSVASLLPFRAGGHAHVLVTSRPSLELLDDVDADHPLRQVQPVELPPSSHAGKLADRATQELHQLLDQRNDDELAVDLVALLTAAEGALSVNDLTELVRRDQANVRRRQVERVVTKEIGRLLQPTGDASAYRFAFAHEMLRQRSASEFADELHDYRDRILSWAEDYQARSWPVGATPLYLFDAYPTLLAREATDKLPALLTDPAYLDTGIARIGVDQIADHVQKARDIHLADADLTALGWCLDQEAHHLRPPYPLDEPGYAIRQLCLRALQGGYSKPAKQAQQLLLRLPPPRLIPRWTSSHTPRSLVRTLTGHDGGINAVAISADGTRAISGTANGTVQVWDLTTHRQLGRPLTGHDGGINAVAISADGTRAISGSWDGTVRVWDLTIGGQFGRPLTGHDGGIKAVAISADGTRAISAGMNRTLRVWDLTTGGQLGGPLTGHEGGIRTVVFSPDGTRAISTGDADDWDSSTVLLWDLTTGRLLSRLLTDASVSISADGTRAFSASGDGDDDTVQVWDLTTGRRHGHFRTGHDGMIRAVFSQDGTRSIGAGDDRTLRDWDLTAGYRRGLLRTGHDGMIRAVAFSADRTRAISAGDDRTLRVWDLTIGGQLDRPLTGHSRGVDAVAISPDGTRAISAGGARDDVTVLLWDLATGDQLDRFPWRRDGGVQTVAITADGTRAISAGRDRSGQVWDLTTGHQLGRYPTGHGGGINAKVAISVDGTRAISADDDGILRVWDLTSGHELGSRLTGHGGSVRALAISQDGTRAISAGGSADEGTVLLWDLTTGHQLGRYPGGQLDGSFTGNPGGINSVAISADGTRAIGGSYDGTIQVWDLTTGGQLGRPLTGHDGGINAVAISPDGTRAISTGDDRILRVWDLLNLKSIDIVALGSGVRSCAIAHDPDGFQVLTGDHLGAMTAWFLHSG